MFIQLDLGWMSHPFPLSSFRLSAPDQIATLRSLGLTRVRWLPLRSDARFARVAEGEAEPAATLEAVAAPASPAQRAEAAAQRERRRLLAAAARGGADLRTPVRRGRAGMPAGVRPDRQRTAEGERPVPGADAGLPRQDAGRRARPVAAPARRRRGRQGRAACDQRRRHLAADGPRLRHVGRRHARPRRRRAAARRRQGRAARAPAPSRRALHAVGAEVLRGARRPRRRHRPPHGPAPGRAAGHRPAPRACRRLGLSAAPRQRPADVRGAHRGAGQPLRQPVQSADSGQGADAARGAVADVRAGQEPVRHRHHGRVHQDDGRLSARLGGAAHRRPLCAGHGRQFDPPAEAARAGLRPARCRATRRC